MISLRHLIRITSLDDVKEWFKTYYGPANATLVIAGDVKAAEVLDKVNYIRHRHFMTQDPGNQFGIIPKFLVKRS